MVMFHQDSIVERFPRVLSLARVLGALEINFFWNTDTKACLCRPGEAVKRTLWAGYRL